VSVPQWANGRGTRQQGRGGIIKCAQLKEEKGRKMGEFCRQIPACVGLWTSQIAETPRGRLRALDDRTDHHMQGKKEEKKSSLKKGKKPSSPEPSPHLLQTMGGKGAGNRPGASSLQNTWKEDLTIL